MDRKKALDTRQAGILMPLSSIPSPSGIGELGEETKRFIRDTSKAGFSIWQILPLNPVGYGNSPYQPYSSFAGDEIYISLEELKKDGLIDEIQPWQPVGTKVEFEKVREWKEPYLKEAFRRFHPSENQEYQEFLQKAFWLDRYAQFRVFKQKNYGNPWYTWDVKDRNAQNVPDELKEELEYQKFLQFIFFKQWKKILKYAHDHGLTVVGDLPIYVGHDSADVWQFQDAFLLDENGNPTVVAGCPPDYFSEDGQLWGNPIYNWKELKKKDYDFWIKRFAWNKEMFDVLRIDHFIGFSRFWSIPSGEMTARNGHYEEGPAYDFFDSVFAQLPDLELIAEDLGVVTPEVTALKDHYGMLGMKISQYSFGPNEKKLHYVLPENCIAYPGTHDNDPINGWYASLSSGERKQMNRIFSQLKLKGRTPADKIVDYSLKSPSRIAVIPMQDLLNLDESARINRPGTIGSPNWEWKMPDFAMYEALLPKIRKEIRKAGRLQNR